VVGELSVGQYVCMHVYTLAHLSSHTLALTFTYTQLDFRVRVGWLQREARGHSALLSHAERGGRPRYRSGCVSVCLCVYAVFAGAVHDADIYSHWLSFILHKKCMCVVCMVHMCISLAHIHTLQ
jgi:hypothetical protein